MHDKKKNMQFTCALRNYQPFPQTDPTTWTVYGTRLIATSFCII